MDEWLGGYSIDGCIGLGVVGNRHGSSIASILRLVNDSPTVGEVGVMDLNLTDIEEVHC